MTIFISAADPLYITFQKTVLMSAVGSTVPAQPNARTSGLAPASICVIRCVASCTGAVRFIAMIPSAMQLIIIKVLLLFFVSLIFSPYFFLFIAPITIAKIAIRQPPINTAIQLMFHALPSIPQTIITATDIIAITGNKTPNFFISLNTLLPLFFVVIIIQYIIFCFNSFGISGAKLGINGFCCLFYLCFIKLYSLTMKNTESN